MNKVFFFLFLVAFSFSLFGQEDAELIAKKANYPINDDYKAGPNLIYDCRRGFYTCVDDDGFLLCKSRRKIDTDKKLQEYSCAHLSKFPTQEACGKKNYEVVESLAKKRFCYPKSPKLID